MQIPNVNPPPRQRFQETKTNISAHREMIQTPEFQRACDFALLQYQGQLAQQPLEANAMNTAAVSHCKVIGALEFLDVFRKLAESPMMAPRIVDDGNLTH